MKKNRGFTFGYWIGDLFIGLGNFKKSLQPIVNQEGPQ